MTTDIEILDYKFIPDIYIGVEAMARVQQYVEQSDKEVGWMGQIETHIRTNGGVILRLVNPYAPRQEVSATTTDLDATGEGSLAEWAMGLKKPETIKWWGHSHVKMGVSPSSTDIDTFKEHVENDPHTPFVMTVHNKFGHIYSNLYLGMGLYVEDATVTINYGTPAVTESVKAELSANVREKSYAQSVKAIGYNPGYQAGKGKGKRGGGGGNRKPPLQSPSKDGNAKSNAVGRRSNRKS